MNKRKIINDPVYGFITIRSELIFDIIDHPYFQRLRRIKQMGLAELVYPGAHHTRFHHAIGAMHLMSVTLENLRYKEVDITDEEFEATLIAILLHDIGHGPFSHALEFSLLKNVHHEHLSRIIISRLNQQFEGKLSLALEIFNGNYHKKFLHQLVSSQLDIDRLDYLKRDSFFSGVSEGTIGADRIIKMLAVHDGELVVEEKGIYSIENFLSARRLMYWQVYLHKAGVGAEKMLISIINRAKKLTKKGNSLTMSDSLRMFFEEEIGIEQFAENPNVLEEFVQLDDYDIWGAIKIWAKHEDFILSKLCQMLLARKLFRIKISNEPISKEQKKVLLEKIAAHYDITEKEAKNFFSSGQLTNNAYQSTDKEIMILSKDGKVRDVAKAADLPNIKAMTKVVRKYYHCWPKDISL
ncbi:HD domain-containing protein [Roseivirga pacifica]|uniref:HD domain-containing protein n=1 Tax=Roseivirga pacifica TaxID=1267423 RepID=UPI0020961C85|nr:HD domain-containing protein [Roseivirga pacifica]MCO6360291.1 HD domain-containing protein [Roseivirga pacifica]MCO6367662.1 HD domain-containing protein [Roseivirga pacifica]MCO6369806.1 HD domain-containing protein [Roseivirga pacifica]MCO6375319.1 HD domain-containing protein [Roseivirga pacifica]MCO6380577.1 HD domain-containing protein [Roseivirga pacifica]